MGHRIRQGFRNVLLIAGISYIRGDYNRVRLYNNNDKYSYYLKNIEVYRKFFLNTIGYTSNSIIWNLYKAIDERDLYSNSLVTATIDKRTLLNGNSFKKKHSDIFEKEIQETILSKNPKHSLFY
jgi:hypothetical protein